ncbi:MAG: helix-turn-helix transcriptional regulator [Chloroflexi bacterium]|nr:helix-turn-helix transcriptional regulator [Chloroflexota bacterium]
MVKWREGYHLRLDPDVRRRRRESLGSFIRECRSRLGLSQTELADRMRVNRTTINRIEQGEMAPRDADRLESFAAALNMSSGERIELFKRAGYVVEIPGEPQIVEELRHNRNALFAMSRQAHSVYNEARATNDYTDYHEILRVVALATAGVSDPALQMLNAQTWRDIADGHQIQRNLLQAEVAYRRAEETAQTADPKGRYAEGILFDPEFEAVRGQSVVARLRDDLDEAVRLSDKALYIARQRPEIPRGFLYSLRRDRLTLDTERGDLRNLDGEVRELLEYAESTGHRLGVALVKSAAGGALMEQGRLSRAERILQEALEEAQGQRLIPMYQAMIVREICRLYERLGDKGQLQRYLKLAIDLSDQVGLSEERRKLKKLFGRHLQRIGLQ